MKKRVGWIAFFIDFQGEIALQGSGMYPHIYPTKRLALMDTHGDKGFKINPPQPVKIEWEE